MTGFESPLMTREEAAKYLGLTVGTLAAWAHDGRYQLPLIKVGRNVMYLKTDIDQWIESRRTYKEEVKNETLKGENQE